jgi:aconitate hydratase
VTEPDNDEHAFRKSLPGTALDYFDARAAVERSSPAPTTPCRTPRACWPKTWCAAAIRPRSTHRSKQLIERKRDLDFPWFPARVVCHDILGQTALVDLAGLRDAIADRAATRRRSTRWCRCS